MAATKPRSDYEALKAACAKLAEQRDKLREQFNALMNARDEAMRAGRASAYLEAQAALADLRRNALQVCAELDSQREAATAAYLTGWVSENQSIVSEASKIRAKMNDLSRELTELDVEFQRERERVKPDEQRLADARRYCEAWDQFERTATSDFVKVLTE